MAENVFATVSCEHSMILRRASAAEIGRAAEEEGMTCLRDDGLMKDASGVTTI